MEQTVSLRQLVSWYLPEVGARIPNGRRVKIRRLGSLPRFGQSNQAVAECCPETPANTADIETVVYLFLSRLVLETQPCHPSQPSVTPR